jgi:hypothetical protein
MRAAGRLKRQAKWLALLPRWCLLCTPATAQPYIVFLPCINHLNYEQERIPRHLIKAHHARPILSFAAPDDVRRILVWVARRSGWCRLRIVATQHLTSSGVRRGTSLTFDVIQRGRSSYDLKASTVVTCAWSISHVEVSCATLSNSLIGQAQVI